MRTLIIILDFVMVVTASHSCQDGLMKSIEYQMKLFSGQSCNVQFKSDKRMRIGFLATSSTNQQNVAQHSVVVFDKVITNDGNGYNSNKGIFTAPVEGLYLFSWTVTATNNKYFITFLDMNGQNMGRNHAGAANWNNPATQTLALHLSIGDKVKIITQHTGQFMHGDGYSTFTGVLIA